MVWNCRGYKSKRNELIMRIQEYDIIVLTKTKYKNEQNRKIYFSGFKTYFKESLGNSGGVSISIRNNIEFDVINQWEHIGNSLDTIGIRLKNVEKNSI